MEIDVDDDEKIFLAFAKKKRERWSECFVRGPKIIRRLAVVFLSLVEHETILLVKSLYRRESERMVIRSGCGGRCRDVRERLSRAVCAVSTERRDDAPSPCQPVCSCVLLIYIFPHFFTQTQTKGSFNLKLREREENKPDASVALGIIRINIVYYFLGQTLVRALSVVNYSISLGFFSPPPSPLSLSSKFNYNATTRVTFARHCHRAH